MTQAGSASYFAKNRDAHWDRMELHFYNSQLSFAISRKEKWRGEKTLKVRNKFIGAAALLPAALASSTNSSQVMAAFWVRFSAGRNKQYIF
jgi:hypothetical protein